MGLPGSVWIRRTYMRTHAYTYVCTHGIDMREYGRMRNNGVRVVAYSQWKSPTCDPVVQETMRGVVMQHECELAHNHHAYPIVSVCITPCMHQNRSMRGIKKHGPL